jgi:branched-chain amino acid transport system substrate-binding protein
VIGSPAGASRRAGLRVGVVVARSGRLAPLGRPVEFVAELFGRASPAVRRGRRRDRLEILVRDSASTPEGAVAAAERLARDGVRLVLCLGGSSVLPAVAGACERLGVPCLSTTLPWQVLAQGRDLRWAYHFCWGLDDIATTFADLWDLAGARGPVGCLWNDGTQGRALRREGSPFLAATAARGRDLLCGRAYREPATDFSAHVADFLAAGVQAVTGACAPADLVAFRRQARTAGLEPRVVTCSRWLTYPFGLDDPALDGTATVVSWTPWHRHRSERDGTVPARLAAAYEQATGRQWLQPLGLAHALFDVAVHALGTAADPYDRASVAEALSRTRVATVAGVLDWTAGPVPNVAALPLAGGQWLAGARPELVVVSNTRAPAAPIAGELRIGSSTR